MTLQIFTHMTRVFLISDINDMRVKTSLARDTGGSEGVTPLNLKPGTRRRFQVQASAVLSPEK